jgi:hypothetical protein
MESATRWKNVGHELYFGVLHVQISTEYSASSIAEQHNREVEELEKIIDAYKLEVANLKKQLTSTEPGVV